jgi:Tfp pilus assembly protein PilP
VLKPTKVVVQGKKSAPGALSPGTQKEQAEADKKRKRLFKVERDPFKTPTEILPSECPPSMPLCRFEYSQLKLVGVIQVADGGFKGMVEDPDGRGYFVTPGMQIGRATVTQVTKNGLTLHEHSSRHVIPIPLPNEGKDTPEF